MSRFFIDRPVFAWVLGLILMLLGGIEVFLLPVAQFPSIAAPQISITVTYPGASAQTVTDTVVLPILQQMVGLDGLEYVSSSAQADGTMEIDLTFVQGTDPNIAQVQVQNKLSLAEANLPAQVTQQGIKVEKSVKNFMLAISFTSADGSMSPGDIGDYVASYIQDPLSRIPGVGDVTLFGSEYAMRVWLDPDKLYKYSLTVADVTNAISAQNVQVSSGELGACPPATDSGSTPRSSVRAASRRRRNSRTSCSRSIRTARKCGCETSRAWSLAPSSIRPRANITAAPRPRSR
jgi:multidrug efflux pump